MEAPLKPKPSDKKYFELRTLKVAAPKNRGVVYRLATSGVVNRKEGHKALLHHYSLKPFTLNTLFPSYGIQY